MSIEIKRLSPDMCDDWLGFLDRVCEEAKKEGYDTVEAYPFSDVSMEFPFHGTAKMYLDHGFTMKKDLGFIRVMEYIA